MRIRIDLVLASLLLLGSIFNQADAQDPNNGAQVVVQTNTQIGQQIVSDGAGGSIVVWMDARTGSYDIYAQRLDPTGKPLWAGSGAPICTAPLSQDNMKAIADGSGGAIIVWQDFRTNVNYDIYAQRINASGQTQWTFNGVPLCLSNNTQEFPDLVSDGSGGAIATWQDLRSNEYDIYAQRIGANGATQWTVNGVDLTVQASHQQFPGIVRDGAGGCIIAWQDTRNGSSDLFAQRLNPSGVAQWQLNGIEVSTALGEQRSNRMVEDGLGGVIFAWEDLRNGPTHVYSQRLNSGGVALWTVNGVAVLTSSAGGRTPRIASDGSAGAIITWEDARNGGNNWDVYAQRIPSGGIPAWTGNGIAVCSVSGHQTVPQIVSAAPGGAIVCWMDERFGGPDIYAQLIDGSGLLQWSVDGEALCQAVGTQGTPMVTSDGTSGAIVVWQDGRYATAYDLFAQRITSTRALVFPDAEHPALVSVRDTPNDQGGRVKLSWRGSNRDLAPIADVTEYRIWRSAPPSAAPSTLDAIDGIVASEVGTVRDPQPGTVAARTTGTAIDYWEYIATQPAGRLTGYSYVAATTSDSIPGSNPKTAFMIEARTLNGASWWYSNVDTGYSVDNLPPFVVAGLAGTYSAGVGVSMHWHSNSDADLAHYAVYRGVSPDFAPGPSNLIGSPADTALVDPNGSFNYYKVAAVDVHSNRGPFATLASQDIPVATMFGRFDAESEGAAIRIRITLSASAEQMSIRILRATSDDLGVATQIEPSASSIDNGVHSFVDSSVEPDQEYWYWAELRDGDGAVALAGPVLANTSSTLSTSVRLTYPNPFQTSTTISYAIGRDAASDGKVRVSLKLYDTRGRFVRTLVDGDEPVGEHDSVWDGQDQSGARLANGVYYWRFQAGGMVRKGSLVLLQ